MTSSFLTDSEYCFICEKIRNTKHDLVEVDREISPKKLEVVFMSLHMGKIPEIIDFLEITEIFLSRKIFFFSAVLKKCLKHCMTEVHDLFHKEGKFYSAACSYHPVCLLPV